MAEGLAGDGVAGDGAAVTVAVCATVGDGDGDATLCGALQETISRSPSRPSAFLIDEIVLVCDVTVMTGR